MGIFKVNRLERYLINNEISSTAKKEHRVIFKIYRALYKASTPKANFDELCNNYVSQIPDFFMRYYLDDVTQESIMHNIISKSKLSEESKTRVRNTVMLGCAPTSCKERFDELNIKVVY